MNKLISLIFLIAALTNAQESENIDSTETSVDTLYSSEETFTEPDSSAEEFYDDSTSSDNYDEPDSSDQERTGYSTYRVNIGANNFDLTDLHEKLASYGFPTLDNAAVQFGFGRTTQTKVIVKEYGLLINSWRNARNVTRKSDLTGVSFSLNYGVDILKPQRVSLFPFVGADLGVLFLKMSYNDIPFNAIATGATPEDQILHNITLNGQTGIGFDIRKSRDGFRVNRGF